MSVNIVKTIAGEKTLEKVAGLIPPAFTSLGDCLEINSDNELDIVDGSITSDKLNSDITNEIESKANEDIISSAYNESTSYIKDSYCIDANELYKCKANQSISGQRPSEDTEHQYWDKVNVSDEIGALNVALSNSSERLTGGFDLYRFGKMRILVTPAYVNCDNSSAYIPAGDRPSNNVRTTGTFADTNWSNPRMGYTSISTSGKITCTAHDSAGSREYEGTNCMVIFSPAIWFID